MYCKSVCLMLGGFVTRLQERLGEGSWGSVEGFLWSGYHSRPSKNNNKHIEIHI